MPTSKAGGRPALWCSSRRAWVKSAPLTSAHHRPERPRTTLRAPAISSGYVLLYATFPRFRASLSESGPESRVSSSGRPKRRCFLAPAASRLRAWAPLRTACWVRQRPGHGTSRANRAHGPCLGALEPGEAREQIGGKTPHFPLKPLSAPSVRPRRLFRGEGTSRTKAPLGKALSICG